MGKTTIEWCDYTFNPWWGCTQISEGCDNCYAERVAARFNWDVWGPETERRDFEDGHWHGPGNWHRKAVRENTRFRVFTGSMCDILEDRRDLDDLRARLSQTIRYTANLDWLLLTKRPQNAERLLPDLIKDWPWNARLGVTAENQAMAEFRIPELLHLGVPNFISIEPMLGPISLPLIGQKVRSWKGQKVPGLNWKEMLEAIHWLIVGGETGPNARPMNPYWVREIRDACDGWIPYFFKGWGEWVGGTYEGLTLDECMPPPMVGEKMVPTKDWGLGLFSARVGRERSGCLLDGKEWKQYPDTAGDGGETQASF